MKQYATYLRVSTQRQGAQGLGISAQRTMCENFIKQNNGEQVKEFMDVESGTHRDRKGLWEAIDYCKKNDCSLVIAKLDRLARDVEFTFKVINTGIDIHFTDMPVVNSMILGVFSAVAQYEREMISKRTKDALASLKARGGKLGGQSDKWQENYKNKSSDEISKVACKRGKSRRERHHTNRDMVVFKKVLMKVFPEYADSENPAKWMWCKINCKQPYRTQILDIMRDYADMDEGGTLFKGWNFTDTESNNDTAQKLRNYMFSFKRSYKKQTLLFNL
jgi:DNA invertase Pin-like site-specific DNA recombinase